MVVDDLVSLGRCVRMQRIALGLSQARVAEECGVTRQWLSRLEQGKEGASVERVLRVLGHLDVSLVTDTEIEIEYEGVLAAGPKRSPRPRRRSQVDEPNPLREAAEAVIAARSWRNFDSDFTRSAA